MARTGGPPDQPHLVAELSAAFEPVAARAKGPRGIRRASSSRQVWPGAAGRAGCTSSMGPVSRWDQVLRRAYSRFTQIPPWASSKESQWSRVLLRHV